VWSDNETAIDSLNVQHVVNAVLQLLDLEQLSPVTIGVYGDWGSGKSSVAVMLKSALEAKPRSADTLCVVFNGWRFEGYDDAKSALMTTVLDELEKHQTIGSEVREAIRKLSKKIDWLRVGKTAGRYALHAGLAVATGGASAIPSLAAESALALKEAKADDIVESAGGYLTGADEAKKIHDTVREFEGEFSKVLARTKLRRLVVIIDDLDRCNPAQIIETLEAIRLFLAVPKTAFIIAADEAMVQNAARLRFPGMEGQTESLGRDYLEKMVQIPVRVPRLGPRDLETYLNMLFLQLHLSEDEFKAACAMSLDRAKDDIVFRVTAANANEVIGKPLTEPMKTDLALAAQVRRVVALSVDGNPRQIKRFLNAFRLRLILASARNVTLDPRVAAKLMLLEYFRLEALRTVARWQAAHDGHALELAAIEASRVATEGGGDTPSKVTATAGARGSAPPSAGSTVPESQTSGNSGEKRRPRAKQSQGSEKRESAGSDSSDAVDLPAEAKLWDRDEWMQAWLDSDPRLGDQDLGPYFYFARDRLAGGTLTTQRMSPKARGVLVQLLSPAKVIRDSATAALKDLQATDAVAIQEALAERVRTSDTLSEASEPFQGLISFIAVRHELVSEFASIIRSLPVSRISAGTPNRLLLAADKMESAPKAVVRALITEWQGQTENPKLAASARIALGVQS
jgi:hypothetical protein